MNVSLVVFAVAVVTLGSRVTALAVMPPPRGAAARVVSRLPAPLFAVLAALSLTGSRAGLADAPMLAAVACALLATRWKSLLVTLAAGLGGFLLATVVG